MTAVPASELGLVTDNNRVAPEHRIMTVEVSRSFGGALPGQFVMLRPMGREEPLLSRPFSIYSLEGRNGSWCISLLYRIVGKGTALLGSLQRGDALQIIGPLGRGFFLPQGTPRMVLVAGGVGIAPLGFLADCCRRADGGRRIEITAYLGARTGTALVGLDRMESLCDTVHTATEDGSRGFRGLVTDLFRDDLGRYGDGDTELFACGPRPMMKALALMAEKVSLPCQVSLEERMACGIGACLGCAVSVRSADDGPSYWRVCADGPVFDARDIDWDDG